MPPNTDLEPKIFEVGNTIFGLSSKNQMSLFEKGYWSSKMMEWSMKYPEFKIEMFRFVDVLPSLTDAEQVAEHIRQYFLRPGLEFPLIIRTGMGIATSTGLAARIAASSIRKNVESMARTFISGSDAASARKTLEKLWDSGFTFTVDILGEAAIAESEAKEYQRRYLDLVRNLPLEVKDWPANPQLESSSLGPVPRANVSVKCSSLYSQLDNLAFRHSVDTIKDRLRPILSAAVERGVFVNLDMEQYDYREMFITVAEEIFSEESFKSYPHFGIVVQAYYTDASADILRYRELARRRGAPITVRLVKGAYWDYEVIQALQRNWPVPVFTQKAATDANYERCADLLLESYPDIKSAFGSHNVRNLSYAITRAESLKLEKTAFEIQMLFGMAEPFKKALSSMGYRVREYAPVGELLPGMAYLVRRLLENTSNEGFLRAKFVNNAEAAVLLADPALRVVAGKTLNTHANQQTGTGPDAVANKEKPMFQNEAFQDFSKADVRKVMDDAVSRLKSKLPLTIPAVVNGKKIEGLKTIEVKNPSDVSQVVAHMAVATRAQVDEAIQSSSKALESWGRENPSARIGVLRKAASLMRKHKAELSALMVLEVGKNYREADADVCEAIDFCDYYAVEMERLAKPQDMGSTPGDANHYLYKPRGLTVAISPWNFPCAILCGMTAAPLVAGNPVMMKPAEQSPAIGFRVYEILREAGVPAEALHFLPGMGEDIGDYMVKHQAVHVINFTGSRGVGLSILSAAAQVPKGQRHIKRAVVELGGKNGLIIDDDADLDEAVTSAVKSAFGFQGQKCSALSRVIVVESAYEKFKARFIDAVSSLTIGPADDVSAKVGPVIDADSRARIEGVLTRFKSQIIQQVKVPESLNNRGHYVPITVLESNDFKSDLGQNEFFGPVVTLFKAKDFDEAIRAMNDIDYALTGGIFSRSPKNLERAKNEIEVGNLYINRPITGALVHKQPFGGYKLSGAGGKAGGPDYLLNFLEPRTISENTMRRGFAPEI